ncbi:NAD(P)H-dependent oxidoreductase [Roseovarius sp. SCSIO 43702]|uniref:NADPH-dependent FMN reductase n=1 Tax=Roseovarius sp. SCSIO 43702 TaxID=2823043 RepID=UPI001C7339D4|nr:NADPH-dependent FMN reductase [Roseovarius sp. SCSIO 43702]QYX57151.1 NAD(P)H-dependent oxidoreductase [Roseovarius sp. SCSIO 43702]
MIRILGISGSLRRASFNTALLRTAVDLMPEGSTLTEGSIAGIPLYDADEEEASGVPPAVETLKEQIAGADGLLLFTPEYNNSLPGVFKNAIDWTTRPAGDIARVYGGKPVAVLGASPGGFGTILAQDAWLGVLRTLGTRPWFEGRLMVSRAGGVFDDTGRMTDDAMRGRLADFLAGFAGFAASHRR